MENLTVLPYLRIFVFSFLPEVEQNKIERRQLHTFHRFDALKFRAVGPARKCCDRRRFTPSARGLGRDEGRRLANGIGVRATGSASRAYGIGVPAPALTHARELQDRDYQDESDESSLPPTDLRSTR